MNEAKSEPAWTANTEMLEDVLDEGPAQRLHALLDGHGSPPRNGDELPLLWHWLYFLPAHPQTSLGSDGHLPPGGFLPPSEFPRRMFAGADISVNTPLTVGQTATRSGTASAPTRKTGKTGPLTFVEVGYDLRDTSGGQIAERQHLVYRPATAPLAERAQAPRADWPLNLSMEANEVLLFRFSALTYNAHRIHYDWKYATRDEGYPGLVVHGPLLAIGLGELLRRSTKERRVLHFSFRSVRPAFAPCILRFVGRHSEDGKSIELLAMDGEEVPLMKARVDLE